MPDSELFVDKVDGNNLNAGTSQGAALLVGTGGSWDATTRVYTFAGSPDLSSIPIDAGAAIMADGTTGSTPYAGRVTAVDNSAKTITLHATRIVGTAPTTGTSNRTCRIGGAWAGPTGSVVLPFSSVVTSAYTNANADPVVIFVKNSATYSGITASLIPQSNISVRGYTTTLTDGGRPSFNWGTTAVTYMSAATPVGLSWENFHFEGNASTGTNSGIVFSTNPAHSRLYRISVTGARASGLNVGNSGCTLLVEECEFYNCNTAAVAGHGGMLFSAAGAVLRNVVCRNNGVAGLQTSRSITVLSSQFVANPIGIRISSGNNDFFVFDGLDVYANTNFGIELASTAINTVALTNSYFLRNTNGGVRYTGSGTLRGHMTNNAFGAGTEVNSGGAYNTLSAMQITDAVILAADATPYRDPANGNFSLALPTEMGQGRHVFLQNTVGFSGTVGSRSRGSAGHTPILRPRTRGLVS